MGSMPSFHFSFFIMIITCKRMRIIAYKYGGFMRAHIKCRYTKMQLFSVYGICFLYTAYN
jgi:hypothetical protein